MSKNVKLLLGRNEKENDALEKRKRVNCIVLKPNYNRGPLGYLEIYDDNTENINKDIVYKSAMIMGYFSKEEKDTLSITASYYNDSDNKEYKSEIIEINNKESKNTKFEQIV